MNILLDLDGVLSDFLTEALVRLNKMWDKTITVDQYVLYNEFNIAKFYGISTTEFWNTLEEHDDYWCNLQPFPWANDLVNYLSTKGEVTICSSPSHHPVCVMQKVEWCLEHLGLQSSALMLGGRKYLMARPDAVLIDDYPKNVESFRAAGGKAILVPSNWNTEDLSLQKVITVIESTEYL